MADRWFYAHDESKFGPFSGRQLRDLADTGEILPTDTIWKEGVEKGVLATRVKNLFLLAETNASPARVSSQPAQVHSGLPASGLSQEAPGETPAPGEPFPDPDDIRLLPEEASPTAPAPPSPEKKKVKKGRAIAVKGAVIVAQDGLTAKYRKKCTTCAHEDSSWNTLRIASGTTRSVYFCPKCRKKREVELQCLVS